MLPPPLVPRGWCSPPASLPGGSLPPSTPQTLSDLIPAPVAGCARQARHTHREGAGRCMGPLSCSGQGPAWAATCRSYERVTWGLCGLGQVESVCGLFPPKGPGWGGALSPWGPGRAVGWGREGPCLLGKEGMGIRWGDGLCPAPEAMQGEWLVQGQVSRAQPCPPQTESNLPMKAGRERAARHLALSSPPQWYCSPNLRLSEPPLHQSPPLSLCSRPSPVAP